MTRYLSAQTSWSCVSDQAALSLCQGASFTALPRCSAASHAACQASVVQRMCQVSSQGEWHPFPLTCIVVCLWSAESC